MEKENQLEEISAWEIHCSPFHNETKIRSVVVIIYAKDKAEAEDIFMKEAHKFFDQDMNVLYRETVKGYRQVIPK